MIIAIDGLAGSGKSTTAREVARRLGFLHADSGALYRAFGLAACRQGWASPAGVVPTGRIPELAAQRVEAVVEEENVVVCLDGEALEDDALRGPWVTAAASKVSVYPEIRDRVNALLRALVSSYGGGGVVCEGRDMGTVVFPDADLKIYMEASPEERARRRLKQQREEPTAGAIRAERERLQSRDRQDSERTESPLRKAEDALVIDTTQLAFDEQVDRVLTAAAELLDTP